MSIDNFNKRLESAYNAAVGQLISQMNSNGFWEGYLSSSALSTATALSALSLADNSGDGEIILSGINWLRDTQNVDGGWGDTPDSPSNLSTTLLCISALELSKKAVGSRFSLDEMLDKARLYAGPSESYAKALQKIYGSDRTFAVPILVNCALAGLVPWNAVPGLPFEMAVFPRSLYKTLRLQVVSYALPALIAVGLAIHEHFPSRNPALCAVRKLCKGVVMKRLAALQPENGGFLEAAPLTSFVGMSLISVFGAVHPIAEKCLKFIRESQREDGSWPIDTNLSVWLTTGAISALANAGELSKIDTAKTGQWIENRQYSEVHPYTGAAPGGWGWTHLPGGVPDADDTSGAIITLSRLGSRRKIEAGIRWLLNIQNADGGWPTFCRGWGRLPFDMSSPDITAHALRAIRMFDPDGKDADCRRAVSRGFDYLTNTQRADGAWVPLWFGNQSTEDKSNPVFGTARVILAYVEHNRYSAELALGIQYMLSSQNTDGGWGGAKDIRGSVEETALAVSALSCVKQTQEIIDAAARGAEFLISAVEDNTYLNPAPIGLYFASLWYSEKLYPVSWTVEALGRILKKYGCEK